MLQKKIQSTIGLIDDVDYNRGKEKENTDIAKKNSIFFDSLEKLTPYIKSYILAKKNFSFTLQQDTADALKHLMNYSKNTFEITKAVEPESFSEKSEKFVNSISEEWKEFYMPTNNELISGLNIIVLVHPMPNVVRGCISALNKCEKLPLTQENIDSYKGAKKNADELLKEMKFDDEIRDFLIKVRDKQATLIDITPSIMDWIQSEDIANRVSLSIRNTIQD